jgi:hypothetical protein
MKPSCLVHLPYTIFGEIFPHLVILIFWRRPCIYEFLCCTLCFKKRVSMAFVLGYMSDISCSLGAGGFGHYLYLADTFRYICTYITGGDAGDGWRRTIVI